MLSHLMQWACAYAYASSECSDQQVLVVVQVLKHHHSHHLSAHSLHNSHALPECNSCQLQVTQNLLSYLA